MLVAPHRHLRRRECGHQEGQHGGVQEPQVVVGLRGPVQHHQFQREERSQEVRSVRDDQICGIFSEQMEIVHYKGGEHLQTENTN